MTSKLDIINENTVDSGVTVDDVLVKDGEITFSGSNQTALGTYEEYTNDSLLDDGADSGAIFPGDLKITKIGNVVTLSLHFDAYQSPETNDFTLDSTDIPSRFLYTGSGFYNNFVLTTNSNSSTEGVFVRIDSSGLYIINKTGFGSGGNWDSNQQVYFTITYNIY